jgi:O-methyltransferase
MLRTLARLLSRAGSSSPAVAPLAETDDSGSDADDLRRARRHEYYWHNAQKKLDLRRLDGFGALAERVRADGRTYLHVDRLYTLWQAVMGMPPGATAAIEVGVFRGGSTMFIAEALRLRGLSMPVYACDTFAGHAVVDGTIDGRHEVGRQFLRVDAADVREYLAVRPEVHVLAGDIHDTAAQIDPQHVFGVAHIDVDVYPPTRFCLERLAPRVVAGGMIVVDDYGFKTCPGAKKAVDEFAAANPGFRLLHLMTGQAVLIKLA